MATTLDAAVTQAEATLAEGRMARYEWRVTLADGREAVCAWMALGGAERDYSACAALGISEPLARLIPWLNDAGSDAAWRPRMARLFSLLRRTPVLTTEDWTALDVTWRRLAVEEAMRHTDDERVLAAARAVVALCVRAEAGEAVPPEEWEKPRAAAWEASRAMAWEASRTRTWEEKLAAWAAEAAARAAASAADVTSARVTTAMSEAVVRTVVADRLAAAILDALEARIVAREATA